MKSAEIRQKFLDFFESKGHLAMKSFSLVPHNDNSLLLINSGMAEYQSQTPACCGLAEMSPGFRKTQRSGRGRTRYIPSYDVRDAGELVVR